VHQVGNQYIVYSSPVVIWHGDCNFRSWHNDDICYFYSVMYLI